MKIMKILPKKTYSVYVYGENNRWLGKCDVSGCKSADECAQKAISQNADPGAIRAISIMDTQAVPMQSARYKVTYDNSKNGFSLSE